MKTGVSGRPPKEFNIIFFNLFLNAKTPEQVMMKIFNLSRGTYYRYKKKLFKKVEFSEIPINELLQQEQRQLFDKYAYKIVDNYSERLWAVNNKKEDFKQECLLRIWTELSTHAIKHFIATCNRICEEVLKETIYKMALEKRKILYYEDYYFENNDRNKLDKVLSYEEEI